MTYESFVLCIAGVLFTSIPVILVLMSRAGWFQNACNCGAGQWLMFATYVEHSPDCPAVRR